MTIEATVSGRVNLAQVVSALASISALAKGEEISQWTIDIIRHSADQLQAELDESKARRKS